MLKTGSGVSVWKRKMHLLVMIAERIRDAKFGNVHQPSFSIPGGREEGKMRRRTLASPPKTTSEHLQKSCDEKPLQQRNPPSAQVCMCVCVWEWGGGGWSGWSGERERERGDRRVRYDECVSSGEAEMNVCMLSVGLFKTEELDEYGTAAVGCCLRGRGFSTLMGRGYTAEGEGKQQEAGLMCSVLKYSHRHRTHKQPAFTTDWSKYTWNHTDKTLLFVLSEEETFYYPILFFFVLFILEQDCYLQRWFEKSVVIYLLC